MTLSQRVVDSSGGGAPNENVRRGNILTEGLIPGPIGVCVSFDAHFESSLILEIRLQDSRNFALPGVYRAGRGGGGGGGPLRSSSVQLSTTDSSRKLIDVNLRNESQPKEKSKMQFGRTHQRDGGRPPKVSNDPWGKCGPGGAPWRDPAQVGQSFMKSMVDS